MTAQLIPPQHKQPSVREQFVAAAYGASVGAVLSVFLCVVTAELFWLCTVPLCALVGVSLHDQKPNVLWGRRAL